MTLDDLMNQAAAQCLDERENHLVIFTQGANGYVCKNAEMIDEKHALFRGTYRECQIWIERRGIAAALQYILEHLREVPELAGRQLTPADLLACMSHVQLHLPK